MLLSTRVVGAKEVHLLGWSSSVSHYHVYLDGKTDVDEGDDQKGG